MPLQKPIPYLKRPPTHITLRVHVPYSYILGPQSPYIGSILRPKYSLFEVGFDFLVSPKGHQVYTLTNIKKEPYIHSAITVIYTLLHLGTWALRGGGGGYTLNPKP